MNIESLQKEAATDLVIDKTKLDIESMNIPYLHGKWMTYFTVEAFNLRSKENKFKILTKQKWLYYTGKASTEEYKEKPIDLKILRNDISIFMESDPELIALDEDITGQRMKCKYIEEIIKAIFGKQWQIRNTIEYLKFISGK